MESPKVERVSHWLSKIFHCYRLVGMEDWVRPPFASPPSGASRQVWDSRMSSPTVQGLEFFRPEVFFWEKLDMYLIMILTLKNPLILT